MRRQMTLLSMVAYFFISFSEPVFAQLNLHFDNVEQAPAAFICPDQKLVKGKKTPSTAQEELSLPSLDEISTALANNETSFLEDSTQLQPLLFRKNLNQPIKIGIWGDSHLAANFFAEELIKSIAMPKEEVLPSFFAANIGRAGVRLPLRKSCLGGGWKYSYAYTASTSNPSYRNLSNDFPIGMIRMQVKNPSSYLWLDFRAQNLNNPPMQSIEILLDPIATNDPSTIGITIDDGTQESLVEIGSLTNLKISADYPFSTIKIRLIQGSLSLDGFIPHYTKTPKLILDNLGIPGSTAKSWTNLTQTSGFIPDYDLAILAYGTNEGNNPKFDTASYQADLKQGLSNFRRVYPNTACILIAPPDRGILVASNTRLKKGMKAHPKQY